MMQKPISPAEPLRSGAEPLRWAPDAEQAMNKVPFFDRGDRRRAAVALTRSRGLSTVTLEIVQDARSHFAR